MKHKKSSSFSNSQFPNMKSYKRHRKTNSANVKKDLVAARKSISFSDAIGMNSTKSQNQLSSQRLSLHAQMYNNGQQVKPFEIKRSSETSSEDCKDVVKQSTTVESSSDTPKSELNFNRMLALFILVALLLSGFLFTPK